MHILTVRSALTESGPGTQSLVIGRQMRDRGYNVSFATSGGAYVDTVREADFPVHIIPELAPSGHKSLSIALAIRKLSAVIRQEQPNVIHGHNAAATICAYGAARLVGQRIPCVTSVRGVEERTTHQWRNRIWKHVPGILIGVCEKTRERLLSFGVPNEKIRVSFNGVDLNRFRPDLVNAEKNRADLGLTGRIVVGTTGGMVPHAGIEGPTKGQHKLVQAMALLKDKHPHLCGLLVGDGAARAFVEKAARDAGIEGRVIFAGRRFDIPEMLSAMDIYCQASIFGEFFPNAIIEAMAMGKPWIGSDIAGLSELSVGNTAGWVTPVGDVASLAANLDKLISDPALRVSRGAAAKAYVEAELTIEKVVDRIEAAYVDAGVTMNRLVENSNLRTA